MVEIIVVCTMYVRNESWGISDVDAEETFGEPLLEPRTKTHEFY